MQVLKEVAQSIPFNTDENTFFADNVQDAVVEATKKNILFHIHKTRAGNNTMSNAQWFDVYGTHAPTGAYAGYATTAYPKIMEYDCKLVEVCFTFRYASFDWRSTPGNIFFNLGFWAHQHNGTTALCKLNMELPGSFSGNNTGTATHEFNITNFILNEGTHQFYKNQKIGVQFRKDVVQPGQIFSIIDPYLLLRFEGS